MNAPRILPVTAPVESLSPLPPIMKAPQSKTFRNTSFVRILPDHLYSYSSVSVYSIQECSYRHAYYVYSLSYIPMRNRKNEALNKREANLCIDAQATKSEHIFD